MPRVKNPEIIDNGVLVRESSDDYRIYFHKQLQCCVRRVSYDFESKAGRVDMVDGSCTDYTGCIEFFKALDPDVTLIETFAGGQKPVTRYERVANKWIANLPAYQI